MPKQNLDLFTKPASKTRRRAKSGSKGSPLQRYIPKPITGACLWCRLPFSEADYSTALPLVAGWVHYRCYVNNHEAQNRMATKLTALKAVAA